VKESEMMMGESTFGNTVNSRYHSISKQRNFQNPPAVRAPSPPAQDNEMVSNGAVLENREITLNLTMVSQ
jgi:hypothetical protein